MANGLQTILNYAETIQFDRRKVVGVQYTRSEVAKVSQTPTRNPWRINVSMKAALPYNDYRDLIEQIDYLDSRYPQVITFSNNPNLSWICSYQGDMTAAQISALTVTSFSGSTLVIQNVPAIAGTWTTGKYLFRAGDFIQIGNAPYPFTVVNDVPAVYTVIGGVNTVSITTNRPNFFVNSPTAGQGLVVGNAVSFYMFCPKMPVYKLIPGATKYTGSTRTNNAYLEWSSDFGLYEYTGGA